MSTCIRLSVCGKKNRPTYRIVVTEKRSKRDGRYLALLGTYNPSFAPPIFRLDHQKFEDWIKRGASISNGLRKLLEKQAASPKKTK